MTRLMRKSTRSLPKYPVVMFYNVAEPSLVRGARALPLFSICKVLHLQHEYPKLTAGVHDENRCQAAHANGDRVNDVTGQSLRELRDFEGRRGSRIEKPTVDREGE